MMNFVESHLYYGVFVFVNVDQTYSELILLIYNEVFRGPFQVFISADIQTATGVCVTMED